MLKNFLIKNICGNEIGTKNLGSKIEWTKNLMYGDYFGKNNLMRNKN